MFPNTTKTRQTNQFWDFTKRPRNMPIVVLGKEPKLVPGLKLDIDSKNASVGSMSTWWEI